MKKILELQQSPSEWCKWNTEIWFQMNNHLGSSYQVKIFGSQDWRHLWRWSMIEKFIELQSLSQRCKQNTEVWFKMNNHLRLSYQVQAFGWHAWTHLLRRSNSFKNFPEFSSHDEGLRKTLEKTEYDTRTYLFLLLSNLHWVMRIQRYNLKTSLSIQVAFA